MITNDEQLHQAVDQLGRMYRALAALRAEVLPKNARQFALMAEGPLDEIRHLQTQIDNYAGVAVAEEHDTDVMKVFEKVDWLLKNFEEVAEETQEKTSPEKFQTWIDFHSSWIDLWKWLRQSIADEGMNSLLLWRSTELYKHLLWLSFSAWVGAYHCVIRELRYVFESVLQAYYVDTKYPSLSMQEKLEKLRELETKKKLSVNKLTKALPYAEELYDIYQNLCKYVHPSSVELEPVIKMGKVEPNILFTFDRELFDKCEKFSSEVMDVLILVILHFHSSIKEKFRGDELMMEMIKSFPSRLCLRYLTEPKAN